MEYGESVPLSDSNCTYCRVKHMKTMSRFTWELSFDIYHTFVYI